MKSWTEWVTSQWRWRVIKQLKIHNYNNLSIEGCTLYRDSTKDGKFCLFVAWGFQKASQKLILDGLNRNLWGSQVGARERCKEGLNCMGLLRGRILGRGKMTMNCERLNWICMKIRPSYPLEIAFLDDISYLFFGHIKKRSLNAQLATFLRW